MFKKILCIGLLTLFFTTPAIADRGDGLPHGKWWNHSEVASQLNLSDKEITLLNDSYVTHRRKLIKLQALVEEEQFELNNLIDSRTIDDQAVLNQAKRLEKARSNLSTERFHFFLDVRKLLGFDRYQQLKSMYQTMRQKRTFERFKNKMNRKHDGDERFHPSSYRDNHGKKPDYVSDKYMDSPELSKESTYDTPPYNDSRDVSEENL